MHAVPTMQCDVGLSCCLCERRTSHPLSLPCPFSKGKTKSHWDLISLWPTNTRNPYPFANNSSTALQLRESFGYCLLNETIKIIVINRSDEDLWDFLSDSNSVTHSMPKPLPRGFKKLPTEEKLVTIHSSFPHDFWSIFQLKWPNLNFRNQSPRY
jgi:hypothetical protein